MNSSVIREKYIEFFESSPRNHKEIDPSPLVLADDPTTLFISSGMQPLVSYLLGKPHPEGNRLVNVQPCFRAVDIDEVGDNRHTTFFEMQGNWSLGDYFKEDQLSWIWDFFTKELELPKDRLYVSVFDGGKDVPRDNESYEIWKKLGIPEERIFFYGVNKNWWSRTGTPELMSPGEIGGPDSEVFFEFTQVKHDPKFGKTCHPNCDCGRFLEIGNSVFIQYLKKKDGSLEELPQKNVDYGGGLERIASSVVDNPDVFATDLFKQIIFAIEHTSSRKYTGKEQFPIRVIADHIKAASFIASAGIEPSNSKQGYILRRLIRRSSIKLRSLKGSVSGKDFEGVVDAIFSIYEGSYLKDLDKKIVFSVISEEVERFNQTLDKGLKEVEKIKRIDGKKAFDLYQTYGFPIELTAELFEEKGQAINMSEFEKEIEKHKKISRSSSTGMFKGGLADTKPRTIKHHTATHLLHAALRKELGEHVEQKGSKVTEEKLRFDFSHKQKLTDDELEKVEKSINEQIERKLPVTFEKMSLDKAIELGALAFFGEKYEEDVKVYTIGDPSGEWFSKEVCGGPHVKNTFEIGHVRIIKQDKIGSNLIRIYAVCANGGS